MYVFLQFGRYLAGDKKYDFKNNSRSQPDIGYDLRFFVVTPVGFEPTTPGLGKLSSGVFLRIALSHYVII